MDSDLEKAAVLHTAPGCTYFWDQFLRVCKISIGPGLKHRGGAKKSESTAVTLGNYWRFVGIGPTAGIGALRSRGRGAASTRCSGTLLALDLAGQFLLPMFRGYSVCKFALKLALKV